MKPTEQEATVAVDAAARALFDSHGPDVATFDDLVRHLPLEANRYREKVLPLVWAALEALPDRAHAAIVQAADVCCTCHTGEAEHDDWCVSVGILQTMEQLDEATHG